MWSGSICPKCGKEFFSTALHAYKDDSGVNYCSYSCLNHRFDDADEYRPIEMLNFDGVVLKTFNSIVEAWNYVGGKPERIRDAARNEIGYRRFKWRYKKNVGD